MKLSIRPPNQIFFGCTLLPIFCENGLKLENCFHISANNNTMNLNQPINLPWKLQLELVNRSLNTTLSFYTPYIQTNTVFLLFHQGYMFPRRHTNLMKLKNNDKNCSYCFYISNNERDDPLFFIS